MAERNPYAMDPNIAAGFSSLSRALLGSAQDDASIAQANLANTRGELVSAQTATEEALRDPRVKSEMALAYQRRSSGNLSLAQASLVGAQELTENARRDPEVDLIIAQQLKEKAAAGSFDAQGRSFDAQAKSRLADAMLTSEKARTVINQRPTLLNNLKLIGQGTEADTGAADALRDSRLADAMLASEKSRTVINQRPTLLNNLKLIGQGTEADTFAADALTASRNADAARTAAAQGQDAFSSLVNTDSTSVTSSDGDSEETTSAVGTNVEYDRFTNSFKNAVKNFGTQTIMTMPDSALAWLQSASMEMVNSDMADGMEFQKAFDENVLKIVRGGVIKANIEGTGGFLSSDDTVSFPKYIFDFHLKDKNNKKLSETIDEMGYSEDEKVAILKAYLAALPD